MIFILQFLTSTSWNSLKILEPQFCHMWDLSLISILAHRIFLCQDKLVGGVMQVTDDMWPDQDSEYNWRVTEETTTQGHSVIIIQGAVDRAWTKSNFPNSPFNDLGAEWNKLIRCWILPWNHASSVSKALRFLYGWWCSQITDNNFWWKYKSTVLPNGSLVDTLSDMVASCNLYLWSKKVGWLVPSDFSFQSNNGSV